VINDGVVSPVSTMARLGRARDSWARAYIRLDGARERERERERERSLRRNALTRLGVLSTHSCGALIIT